MTRPQRLIAFAIGAIAIVVLARAIIPRPTSPSPPSSIPSLSESERIAAAITVCDVAMADFSERLAGKGDATLQGRYEAAVRAEEQCRVAYIQIGKLPRTDLSRVCEEDASIRHFAAKKAVELFGEAPTPRKMKDFEAATADVPSGTQACSSALKVAQTAQ